MPAEARAKVTREVELERVAGPFNSISETKLMYLIISPIGLVPQVTLDFRLYIICPILEGRESMPLLMKNNVESSMQNWMMLWRPSRSWEKGRTCLKLK